MVKTEDAPDVLEISLNLARSSVFSSASMTLSL